MVLVKVSEGVYQAFVALSLINREMTPEPTKQLTMTGFLYIDRCDAGLKSRKSSLSICVVPARARSRIAWPSKYSRRKNSQHLRSQLAFFFGNIITVHLTVYSVPRWWYQQIQYWASSCTSPTITYGPLLFPCCSHNVWIRDTCKSSAKCNTVEAVSVRETLSTVPLLLSATTHPTCPQQAERVANSSLDLLHRDVFLRLGKIL